MEDELQGGQTVLYEITVTLKGYWVRPKKTEKENEVYVGILIHPVLMAQYFICRIFVMICTVR